MLTFVYSFQHIQNAQQSESTGQDSSSEVDAALGEEAMQIILINTMQSFSSVQERQANLLDELWVDIQVLKKRISALNVRLKRCQSQWKWQQ